MIKKLSSLSIFFPFYNDAGTVQKAIGDAYRWGREVSKTVEVIAIHGGNSKDDTFAQIKKAKKKYPGLIIVDKTTNDEGYAVIKYGFKRATKEWIFYTDGDLQYDVQDLKKLATLQMKTNADIVNGYKTERGDNALRTTLGNAYILFTKILFRPPIRDVTCDFRLMRAKQIKQIKLDSKDASILLEMLKKLQKRGATFAEANVAHHPRTYGKSSYTPLKLLKERFFGDIRLYFSLRKSL